MTQGQIEALEHHACDAVKALFLPKLVVGRMVRHDEPDRAAGRIGRRRAADQGRAERRRHLCGQRAEDLHLVGRQRFHRQCLPPGAGAAARRRRRAPRGSACSWCRNTCRTPMATRAGRTSLKVVSLEHKMGLHGSPTAVMQYDGATGWLVGAPHRRDGGDVHHDEQRPARRRRAGHRPGRGRLSARAGLCRGPPAGARRRAAPGRSSTMPTCGGCWRRCGPRSLRRAPSR